MVLYILGYCVCSYFYALQIFCWIILEDIQIIHSHFISDLRFIQAKLDSFTCSLCKFSTIYLSVCLLCMQKCSNIIPLHCTTANSVDIKVQFHNLLMFRCASTTLTRMRPSPGCEKRCLWCAAMTLARINPLPRWAGLNASVNQSVMTVIDLITLLWDDFH